MSPISFESYIKFLENIKGKKGDDYLDSILLTFENEMDAGELLYTELPGFGFVEENTYVLSEDDKEAIDKVSAALKAKWDEVDTEEHGYIAGVQIDEMVDWAWSEYQPAGAPLSAETITGEKHKFHHRHGDVNHGVVDGDVTDFETFATYFRKTAESVTRYRRTLEVDMSAMLLKNHEENLLQALPIGIYNNAPELEPKDKLSIEDFIQKRAREEYNALDTDKSGFIEKEEAGGLAQWVWEHFHGPTAVKMTDQQRAHEGMKILARADKNSDGKISFQEFAVYFRATATAHERFLNNNARRKAELMRKQAAYERELAMVPSKDDLKRAKRVFNTVDSHSPDQPGKVAKSDLLKLEKGDVEIYMRLPETVTWEVFLEWLKDLRDLRGDAVFRILLNRLDKETSGKALDSAEVQRLMHLFTQLDGNSSGTLERDEVLELHGDRPTQHYHPDALFATLNTEVRVGEWLRFLENVKSRLGTPALHEVLDNLEWEQNAKKEKADHDYLVSHLGKSPMDNLPEMDENQKLQIESLLVRAKKKFEKFDTDGDGALDYWEMDQMAEWIFTSFHPEGEEISPDVIRVESEKIRRRLDADDDHQITFIEFAEYFVETASKIMRFRKAQKSKLEALNKQARAKLEAKLLHEQDWAANHPKLTSAEIEALKNASNKATKKFNEIDSDNNQHLDRREVEELAVWVWQSFHPGQEIDPKHVQQEADKIFERCDSDDNGWVGFDEFSAWYEKTVQAIFRFRKGKAEAAHKRKADEKAAAAAAAAAARSVSPHGTPLIEPEPAAEEPPPMLSPGPAEDHIRSMFPDQTADSDLDVNLLIKSVFEECDLDKDGKLSPSELQLFIQRRGFSPFMRQVQKARYMRAGKSPVKQESPSHSSQEGLHGKAAYVKLLDKLGTRRQQQQTEANQLADEIEAGRVAHVKHTVSEFVEKQEVKQSRYKSLQDRMHKRRFDKHVGHNVPSDVEMTEEEEILDSVVKQVFEHADCDKDGTISPLELRAYVVREGMTEHLAQATHRSPGRSVRGFMSPKPPSEKVTYL